MFWSSTLACLYYRGDSRVFSLLTVKQTRSEIFPDGVAYVTVGQSPDLVAR